MRFATVCSGIEAASLAWHPLGWEAAFYSEIAPFASAVLHHHYGSGRPLFMPDPDEAGLGWREQRQRRNAIKAVARIPLANMVAVPFDTTQITHPVNKSNPQPGDPAGALAKTGHPPVIAFHGSQDPDVSGAVTTGWRVRRLMPVECERLMGMPDGYTAIIYNGKPAADGPRYMVLGNSWPVNVARVIGERIDMIDKI